MKIDSAEDWVISNFGRGLYELFFKVYNEKIWGLPSSEISPNWAGTRIKSSLIGFVYQSLKRKSHYIVKTFDFPKYGSASLCERQMHYLRRSNHAKLKFSCKPVSIHKPSDSSDFRVVFDDHSCEYFSHIIATCHLSDLSVIVHSPKLNTSILQKSVNRLTYRNLILVNLVFREGTVNSFNEHWIDVHDPKIKTLRVTNFSRYDSFTSPSGNIAIGIEYNCFESDNIWKMQSHDLIEIACNDLFRMGLISEIPINSAVKKFSKAYPVYFKGYEDVLQTILHEFNKIKSLQLVGRNALYKWNNMHHSVKTGILAARNCTKSTASSGTINEIAGLVAFGQES